VEHASPEAIQEALAHVYSMSEIGKSEITQEDLVEYGLVGGVTSKVLREQLGERLKIGYTNGKQLYKRLTMFQITREEFIDAMEDILQNQQK